MSSNLSISKMRLVSAIVVSLLSLILALPNFLPNFNIGLIPSKTVNLGLDLRGGAHLLFKVDFKKYFTENTEMVADNIKRTLRKNKIDYRNVKTYDNKITFEVRNSQNADKAAKYAKSVNSDLQSAIQDNTITLFHDAHAINKMQDQVIQQSIEIIRLRVDSTGTTEPIIQRQGADYILLQVPGANDPAELKRLVGKTAKLTFHLVDNNANLALASEKGATPSGSKIVNSSDSPNGILVVKKKVIVSGDQLTGAQATFSQQGQPVVDFEFNSLGAKRFADVTTKNRGTRLAIILDNEVISAPNINEPIIAGKGIIFGNFTVDSAAELATLLRAGALPTRLEVIEERSVGPSLGNDSIESGKKAALIGFLMVVIFMFVSYGTFGIFANFTLCLTLLYILALLSTLQATLTLPGIAGIILTIGMAVDANVLIYERIREELNKGSSNLYSVKVGFESAFATITDSNVTTLIAAFLLYNFGVGAIRGFAVTLTIGIIASMFSALIVTKLFIDLWLKYYKPKKLGL